MYVTVVFLSVLLARSLTGLILPLTKPDGTADMSSLLNHVSLLEQTVQSSSNTDAGTDGTAGHKERSADHTVTTRNCYERSSDKQDTATFSSCWNIITERWSDIHEGGAAFNTWRTHHGENTIGKHDRVILMISWTWRWWIPSVPMSSWTRHR